MFWGCSMLIKKSFPPLHPLTVDFSSSDLIILGGPVWAFGPAKPLLSFLDKNKITGKKLALFCSHAGNRGKFFEKIKKLLPGNSIAGEIDFKNPYRMDRDELEEKVGVWLKSLYS